MPKRILTVDDEAEICRIIQIFLTAKGFEVRMANSADEALALIDKEKFDLVILDKRMPGTSSLEVARKVRQGNDTTPVMILSGSNDEKGMIDKFKDLGCGEFLIKPVDLEVLLDRVNSLL